MDADVDVVVVGAGLSGLQAARDLAETGLDVLVLEARERPGGRAHTVESPAGTRVDLGATWFGTGDTRVAALAEEIGLTPLRQGPEAPPPRGLRARLAALRGPVPRARLQEAAATSGGWTFDEWLRRSVRTTAARESLAHDVRLAWGAEPDEIALHDAARPLPSGPRWRLAEGAQALAEGLVEHLGPGAVRFDAAVSAVRQQDGLVEVRSEGGGLTARAAILALPPAVAVRIAFEPAWPAGTVRRASGLGTGAAVTAAVFFETPPGFLCAPPPGVDVLSVPGRDGALVVGLRGRRALEVADLPSSERRAALLHVVRGCLGPQAPEPLEVVDVDWTSEPWSRGGPAGFLTPGQGRDTRARLRAPQGRLFFAGAETDDDAPHRMEGALASGARAAAEAAAALGSGR